MDVREAMVGVFLGVDLSRRCYDLYVSETMKTSTFCIWVWMVWSSVLFMEDGLRKWIVGTEEEKPESSKCMQPNADYMVMI